MALKHSPEEQKRILEAIERFWYDQTDEEIGIIKRQEIFDFFNGLIGSSAYNRGIADAQEFMQTKLIDLEIELHEDVHYRPKEPS